MGIFILQDCGCFVIHFLHSQKAGFRQKDGTKVSGVFLFEFASSTTFIMNLNIFEKNENFRKLIAALSKETDLSKELWDFYADI